MTAEDLPRPRAILLGASNVTRGVAAITETARLLLTHAYRAEHPDRADQPVPVDVYAALGHGRSYGQCSRVLLRSVPGILESRLWEVTPQTPPPWRTYALLTDIGNDIMFGYPAEQILQWVETCLQRLETMDARVVMTALPAENAENLAPLHYLIARQLLFPRCRFTFDYVVEQVHAVNAGVAELAAQYGAKLVRHQRAWYGLDPIHLKPAVWLDAWRQILSAWLAGPEEAPPDDLPRASRSLARMLYLRTGMHDRWWLLSLERRTPQPVRRLPGGGTLSLY